MTATTLWFIISCSTFFAGGLAAWCISKALYSKKGYQEGFVHGRQSHADEVAEKEALALRRKMHDGGRRVQPRADAIGNAKIHQARLRQIKSADEAHW